MSAQTQSAPLYGLILAGGSSSRMNRDKAALKYQGQTQLDRAYDLARRHLEQVYVSVRAAQISEPTRAHKPMIVDSFSGEGPIIGIRSALAAYPEAAWLVLACDLPFLSDAAVEHLLRERDPSKVATAFKSTYDGLPEPLCAIWEPGAAALLGDYQSNAGICPRKFLIRQASKLLEPFDGHALDNINTPEEYTQAAAELALAAPIQLKVQYYALMREQAGRSEETLETKAGNPSDLYAELVARYGFTLSREQLKVAVNSEFSDWSRKLAAGDAVVFIPPVAGG
jgi:molybdopterin-guanine dinucleotide biosynthesis protein A